mmetsp:Transcript_10444/g.34584  ORF Transcript_10444/g.34584 Transcript_10444/m.34584 type:complete len:261 (-) Transcript_10444:285-1067(-)
MRRSTSSAFSGVASNLLQTITRASACMAFCARRRSSRRIGSEASTMNMQTSQLRISRSVALMDSLSMTLHFSDSRIPAVSTRRIRRFSNSRIASTASRVTPGVAAASAISSRASVFSRVDLPTLARPRIATRISSIFSGSGSSNSPAGTTTVRSTSSSSGKPSPCVAEMWMTGSLRLANFMASYSSSAATTNSPSHLLKRAIRRVFLGTLFRSHSATSWSAPVTPVRASSMMKTASAARSASVERVAIACDMPKKLPGLP